MILASLLGALTTLQYSFTAAPTSQPMNTIFAQIFGGATSILISYTPNIILWFCMVLAPTIVIPGMAELGTTHFPAGAAYILFVSGDLGWGDLEIFLLGVAIANLTTVCIV